MGKLVDLTNKKFGRLTVLGYWGIRKERTCWNCLCECGNGTIVSGHDLKRGHTLSCGCLRIDNLKKACFLDLTNLKFGRLTVIKFSYTNKHGSSMWDCVCDCGNEIIVNVQSLNNGTTSSCGCFQKEMASKSSLKNLIGITFGKLLVLKYLGSNKNQKSTWLCLCECGNEISVVGGNLTSGSTVSCGCLRESYIASELKKYYSFYYGAKTEYKKFINSKTGEYLPFDIFIECENIYIEVNGEQHYKFIPAWHRTIEKFEYNKKLGRMKRKYARQNGVYVEIDLRKIKTTEEAIAYIESFI